MSEVTKRLMTDTTGQDIVQAIEGLSIAVKPNATDIHMSSSDSTSVAQKINNEIATVADSIAIVAEGDVHAAIAAGQFVYVRNHPTLAQGGYKATAAIGTNATLSTSNLTLDNTGGLNDLQAQITSLNSKITPSGLKNGNIDTYFDQDSCWIQSANSSGSQPGFSYYQLEIIPNGNGQVVQRATEMANSRIANRLYANGAWSPWEPVALSREITSLNSKFTPTAQVISFTATTSRADVAQVIKSDHVVMVSLNNVSFANAISEGDVTLATLPYKPLNWVRFFGYTINGNPVALAVNPVSGNLVCSGGLTPLEAGKLIYAFCVYITNDQLPISRECKLLHNAL